MKLVTIAFTLAAFGLGLAACKKDKEEAAPAKVRKIRAVKVEGKVLQQFEYNGAHRLTQINYQAEGTSEFDSTRSFSYDGHGNVAKIITSGKAGHLPTYIDFHYNQNGQATSYLYYSGPNGPVAKDSLIRNIANQIIRKDRYRKSGSGLVLSSYSTYTYHNFSNIAEHKRFKASSGPPVQSHVDVYEYTSGSNPFKVPNLPLLDIPEFSSANVKSIKSNHLGTNYQLYFSYTYNGGNIITVTKNGKTYQIEYIDL